MHKLCKAVLGAGAAGLVAARELRQEHHRVTIFEAGPRPGGVWVYTDHVEEDDLLGALLLWHHFPALTLGLARHRPGYEKENYREGSKRWEECSSSIKGAVRAAQAAGRTGGVCRVVCTPALGPTCRAT